MKHLTVLFVVSFLLLACGKTAYNANLGESSKVKVDDVLDYKEEKLEVKLVSITEDSRCPKGSNCIWEGQVVINLNVSDQSVLVNTQKPVDTLGYTFSILSVTPTKTNDVIDQKDYTIELLINK